MTRVCIYFIIYCNFSVPFTFSIYNVVHGHVPTQMFTAMVFRTIFGIELLPGVSLVSFTFG